MEIDNSNLSNIIASSISKLNITSSNASNISNGRRQKSKQENFIQENEKDDVKLIDDIKPFKTSIDFEEIQSFANSIGEELSQEEIQYGLKYGRSVIVDYSA